MANAAPSVLVLTYHSISDDPGPTAMPRAAFEAQMDALVDSGRPCLTLDEFLDWRTQSTPRDGTVLITFDDALCDFAAEAHPILRERNLPALMFTPTARAGGVADWDGDAAPIRPIMDWDAMARLAEDGVTFGAHGAHHLNLTTLQPNALADELDASKATLESRLGKPARAFAAPFGATNPTVIAAIAQRFDAAFGTRFDKAGRDAPLHDIPRIDMHYFRDARRWRGFLDGETLYFTARQTLRSVREAAVGVIARRRANA
ncbi:MAG: polysaccharide deacetylase family protein [Alphaproteobacteria bacterium]|nr:polysaccharide deacetylase family protein [Alphaproteobacteria bacterium]